MDHPVVYPVAKFYFTVTRQKDGFNNAETIGFTEVSGLSYESDVIEYRHGSDKALSKVKIAGLRKFGNVTLKRGIIKGAKESNSDFYSWVAGEKTAFSVFKRTDYRRDIVITLNDEAANPVISWTLHSAFPIKVAFSDMKADANEVAVETLELAVENITVEYL